jgi:hypothetical protein
LSKLGSPAFDSGILGPLSRRYRPTPGWASMLNPEIWFDVQSWRKKPTDSGS